MEAIEAEIKLTKETITKDLQKSEEKSEIRTFNLVQRLQEDIRMIGKISRNSVIEEKINIMLENQQILQTTMVISEQEEQNQRERSHEEEMRVII
jgi:hypothetical protein